MYGRRDGQWQVAPFDPRSAALFTPRYSPVDKVTTFAVCGGMPYYLARPVTASPTSKKTSYVIRDGFLNFYFRFVEPYKSRLRSRADAERHLEQTVLPQLDLFAPSRRGSGSARPTCTTRSPTATASSRPAT